MTKLYIKDRTGHLHCLFSRKFWNSRVAGCLHSGWTCKFLSREVESTRPNKINVLVLIMVYLSWNWSWGMKFALQHRYFVQKEPCPFVSRGWGTKGQLQTPFQAQFKPRRWCDRKFFGLPVERGRYKPTAKKIKNSIFMDFGCCWTRNPKTRPLVPHSSLLVRVPGDNQR